MKSALLPLAAGLVCSALAPLSAQQRTPVAASSSTHELRREWIAPDAQLVVHFDFKSFQKSTIWKVLLEHEDDIHWDDLDELRTEFGIDPLVDLKSLTAYSRTHDADDGVALITGSSAIDKALARIKMEHEYSQITVEGFDLHVWNERGNDEAVAYIHTMNNGDRVVVLSDTTDSTIAAARIVRGEAANHKSANGKLTINPAPGSFFYLSTSSIPGVDDLPPASRIASLTKDIHIDVGETNGTLNASVSAMTSSPEDALQAAKMVEGFKAIGYFAAQELGVSNLLESVHVDSRGSQLLIQFSYDVRSLVEEVKTLGDTHGPY